MHHIEMTVLRDTVSTTCVVKSSVVKPEQMTESYQLCMFSDGVVKRYSRCRVRHAISQRIS